MTFTGDRDFSDAHRRYEDDLAAYLLGALPGAEEVDFRGHLESCQRCRERERWLRAAVDLLPSSVDQLTPPPALRDRLLATVESEAAEATASAGAGLAGEPGRSPRAAKAKASAGWRRWFSLPLQPAPAMAMVLIAAVGVGAFLIGDHGGSSDNSRQVIRAAATPAEPGARASLVRTGDQGTLRIDRLPLRRGKVYAVWVVKDGQDPRPAGLFAVDRTGRGRASIPTGLDQADRVLVTPEPPGGSPQPTAVPVLSIDV